MKKRRFIIRVTILSVLAAICLTAISLTLTGIQLRPASVSSGKSGTGQTVVRTSVISASRGEIYDRAGRPLVVNVPEYAVLIDWYSWEDGKAYQTLNGLFDIMDSGGITRETNLPISGEPYSYTAEEGGSERKKFDKFLKSRDIDGGISAEEAVSALRESYSIPSDCSAERGREIIAALYDMYRADFSAKTPFTLAAGLDSDEVSQVAEQKINLHGAYIDVKYTREYQTDYAAHILGRVGSIYAEDLDEYLDAGYAMNAIVGRSGAEKAFEDYLRGTDGELVYESTTDGEKVGVVSETPARSGGNVYLTIDLDLQEAAEKALERRIVQLREENPEVGGGAAVVVDVKTGEALAVASYPSYDLETFGEDYNELSRDSLSPLFNRAIAGTYAPGSTFKMVTATGALQEGAITPETVIRCDGIYTYYAPDYLPRCWIYMEYGMTHGPLTVVGALENSCNCFFYEAGRLLGIDGIDKYAKLFGLGEYTGIELPGEAKGVMAGPDEREEWYAGDTLSAAIGQSDSRFTPLQLANYVATIVNGGTRYAVHVLKSVTSADGREIVYNQEPEVESTIEYTQENLQAVLTGMLAVTEDGTASSVFSDFPYSVVGKSGSAQVTEGTANGIFVLAAPADDPEVAVAVVVEHGGSGKNVAWIARDILTAYFNGMGSAGDARQVNSVLS